MKIFRSIAKIIVFIMILNGVAFAVLHIMTHGKMFGKLAPLVMSFAGFPHDIKNTIGYFTAKVKNHQLVVDPDFVYVNDLDSAIYGMISYNNENADSVVLKLLNFQSNTVVHEWKCEKEKRFVEGLCSNHPLLLDDYSIIFKLDYDLFRMDSNSNIVWKNSELMFHHTLEFDHEGYLWSPTTVDNGKLHSNTKIVNYETELPIRDEGVTKIDPATGKIVFTKSVAEILLENGYPALVYGFWQYDPFHLNDIEPVLEDSKYWKKGDLFLSCRNIHTVFLYRPSTNKIMWLRTGYWVNQHDVDIQDATHITVYNNNVNWNFTEFLFKDNKGGDPSAMKVIPDELKLNTIVVYDFEKDSTSTMLPDFFKREKIDTRSQGVFTALSNGLYFIEETDQGKLYFGNNEQTLFKMQLVAEDSTFSYYPGWSRIYDKIPMKKGN